jgi:hypothetical protein
MNTKLFVYYFSCSMLQLDYFFMTYVMTTKLFVYCYVFYVLGIDDLLLTIVLKLLLFSILSIEIYFT